MRDNHDGLPEILDAIERGGEYFALIQLEREGKQARFQFAVTRAGYSAVKRALQLRPFDQMPGARYRVFFVPSVQRLENERVMMWIRVEQGTLGKQMEVEAPEFLFANLMWFWELNDWQAAEQFRIEDSWPR